MILATQFPIADYRSFLSTPKNAAPLARWIQADNGGQRKGEKSGEENGNLKFLRGFGSAGFKLSREDRGWVDDESLYCDAHRAISLPSLERRRLGDAAAQFIPIGAFCRLVYDRSAVSQVQLAVRHSRWAPPLREIGKAQLLRIICDFAQLPSSVGDDPARPLILQGAYLAERYFRATTTHCGLSQLPEIRGMVEYGNPLVIVEVERWESVELPADTALDSSLLGGVNLAFFRIKTEWGPVAVGVLSSDGASSDVLRKVRLCLLRLHAEREVLDLALRQIKRGRLVGESGNPRLDLDKYLNSATWAVAQKQKYGIAQSVIAEAFDRAVSVEQLDASYGGIRRQILDKTKQYDERRGHLRMVKAYAPGNAETPLLSSDDPVVTGVSLSDRNQAELHWNTRFPHDAAANSTKVIFAEVDYLAETGIETRADPGGLSAINLDTARLAAQTDGQLNIFFRIGATSEVLRLIDEPGEAPRKSIVSPPLPCMPGIGTPRFPFLLRAKQAAATLELELSVIMQNSVICAQTLPLRVINLPAEPAAAPMQSSADSDRHSTVVPEEPQSPSPTIGEPLGSLALKREAKTEAIIMIGKESIDGREYFSIEINDGDWLPNFTSAKDSAEINRLIIQIRKRLVELSRQYQPIDGDGGADYSFAITGPKDAMLEFARLGFQLHEYVFGNPFQGQRGERWDAAIRLARLGRDQNRYVQIFGANVPIPWALMYDARAYGFVLQGDPLSAQYLKEPERPEDVDPNCFWGVRWAMYRTIRQPRNADAIAAGPRQGSIVACVNPHLDNEIKELLPPGAEYKTSFVNNQKSFLHEVSSAVKFVESREQFSTFLRDEEANRCKFLYFFCHAEAARTLAENMLAIATLADEQASIRLDRAADKKINIDWMDHEATSAILSRAPLPDLRNLVFSLKNRPLVFMNTCSSTQGDVAYPSPFIDHFKCKWGACGFIGTDWKVPTAFADPFGRRVLDLILRNKQPVITAFHQVITEAIRSNNPFGLIYGIYASPDCALEEV